MSPASEAGWFVARALRATFPKSLVKGLIGEIEIRRGIAPQLSSVFKSKFSLLGFDNT